ncbi:hypothetical protein QEH56_24135 [Pelagicoccus enzymogenes]|nr:hypothetical protein [Pelagicoccus enzymogenes]MDQ8201271.1 hypothetical protein [Pelagicoccus enzymogenes]
MMKEYLHNIYSMVDGVATALTAFELWYKKADASGGALPQAKGQGDT